MGWSQEEEDGERYPNGNEGTSSVKEDKCQEKAEAKKETEEKTKNSEKHNKEETEEERKKKCIKAVTRYYKLGKSPQETHAFVMKKYGGIMTLDEITAFCSSLEAKISSSSKVSSSSSAAASVTSNLTSEPDSIPTMGDPTAAAEAADTSVNPGTSSCEEANETSPTKKRQKGEKYYSSDDGRKKKHIGRPPDEDKQRTIVETVKINPTISLRTVAANLDCSKSQVARVLAMNGFQRNKGRIGEWQRVSSSSNGAQESYSVESIVMPQSLSTTTTSSPSTTEITTAAATTTTSSAQSITETSSSSTSSKSTKNKSGKKRHRKNHLSSDESDKSSEDESGEERHHKKKRSHE